MIPGIMVMAGMLSSTASAGGGSTNPVNISAKSISKVSTGGAAATASFTFKTDRSVINQDGTTVDSSWLDAGSTPSDYQIRVTLASGNAPSGSSLATWLSLSTNRTWSLTDAAGASGTKTCKLTIEIRDAASPNTIRDTATYTMTADSQSSGGTGATFTPAPGSYTADDNADFGDAVFAISASTSVTWNYSIAGSTFVVASRASGTAGTSIDFELRGSLHADRTATVTVTVGSNTWTIFMSASALDGGGLGT